MAGFFDTGLGGGILGGIGKGIDFGLGAASSAIQAKQIRSLRRKEYQDMMHSMRQAGLNPILASGATPGHSAVTAPDTGGPLDLQRDVASAQESRRRQNLNESERALLDAQKVAAEAGADKATQDAAASRYLMEAQRLKLIAEERNLGANTDYTQGPNTAATWGLAELRGADVANRNMSTALLEQQVLSEPVRRALMADQGALAQMETTLVEAKRELAEIDRNVSSAKEKEIAYANVQRRIEAEWKNGPVGKNLERFNIAAGQILGPIAEILNMRPKRTASSTGEDSTTYDSDGRVTGSRTSHRTHRSESN